MLIGHRHRTLTREGRAAGEQFVQDDAQGVDVGSFVGGETLRLLGGEVGGGPDHRARPGQLLGVVQRSCDAEVGDPHRAIGCQHDVARFYVTVVDACGMSHGEGRGRFGDDLGGTPRQQRSFGSGDVTERASFDQLHDHVVGVAVLTEVVDADDVGMAQVGGRLGLATETRREGPVRSEVRMQDLDRHRSAEGEILRLEDVAHAPASEVSDDSVATGQGASLGHDAQW